MLRKVAGGDQRLQVFLHGIAVRARQIDNPAGREPVMCFGEFEYLHRQVGQLWLTLYTRHEVNTLFRPEECTGFFRPCSGKTFRSKVSDFAVQQHLETG